MSRQGIQSVEIGLRILEAVSTAGGAAPLKDIAFNTGLSASQTHKYLVSLANGGMVRQQESTGLYDLGPAAVSVGLSAIARQDAIEVAANSLRNAVKETGRMGLLSVMGPHGITVIRIFAGTPAFATNLTLGTILPLTHSATGFVFLAHMNDSETDTLVEQELANDKAKKTFSRSAVTKSVLEQGYASVDNMFIPGLRAQAAPMFNLQGEITSVATLVASGSFTHSNDTDSLSALLTHCSAATSQLGGHQIK